MRALLAAILLLAPAIAGAHSFGRVYNLPVPFWLYAWGAAAALIVSFAIVGYFVSTPAAGRDRAGIPVRGRAARLLASPRAATALRITSLLLLVLAIATGLLGTRNAYANFNMTFFWVVFVLGFAYLTALTGNLYAVLNPWRVLVESIERVAPAAFRGRVRYPARLEYYPAVLLYVAFIWIELFGNTRPFSLSVALLGYTALSLAGAWLVGKEPWFRYCEFFGPFFRILSRMAPLDRRGPEARLRPPFVRLLDEPVESPGLLLFLLFMLSSTAFDGLRETVPWMRLFWTDVYGLLEPLVGGNIVQAYPLLRKIYLAWQTVFLVLSPLLYLALYLLFIAMARRLARSALTIRELALRFGYTLVPIAFVYHVTHYYTLLVSQGAQSLALLSDPFGFGWNLLGTARWGGAFVIDAGTVWHTQVALILIGHIVSVYLAHVAALRLFATPRQAVLSQLPMLVLMVAFTTAGLWILSLPLQSGGSLLAPS